MLLEIHDYFRERKEYYGLFTTRSFYWLNSQQPTGIKSLNSNHNNILYMQQLYEGIYNAYHEIGADSVDDPDVVLHDLIVLDQPHRVAAQAEFKRHKKIYGELLSQRVNKHTTNMSDKVLFKLIEPRVDQESRRMATPTGAQSTK